MKKFIGLIGVLLGIALGAYVGVWLMLVGGILGVVAFIQGMIDGNTDGVLLAWSIVKIIFSGTVGAISAYIFILPSVALIGGAVPKFKRKR